MMSSHAMAVSKQQPNNHGCQLIFCFIFFQRNLHCTATVTGRLCRLPTASRPDDSWPWQGLQGLQSMHATANNASFFIMSPIQSLHNSYTSPGLPHHILHSKTLP
jgi:hypothetical protein